MRAKIYKIHGYPRKIFDRKNPNIAETISAIVRDEKNSRQRKVLYPLVLKHYEPHITQDALKPPDRSRNLDDGWGLLDQAQQQRPITSGKRCRMLKHNDENIPKRKF